MMTQKQRYKLVFDWFILNMPVVETELRYNNPFELLVAVILSAQCTDKRVNQITPRLFNDYPTPEAMSKATPETLFDYIRTISYPNNKANHLAGMARRLYEHYNGIVPEETNELQTLPGVGRKTANVVASVIYNKPTMAVDTHVFRVSNRLGLTLNSKNPLQTELELIKHIPTELIPRAHHWLILHGRYVCIARKPKCNVCGIKEWCIEYVKLKV